MGPQSVPPTPQCGPFLSLYGICYNIASVLCFVFHFSFFDTRHVGSWLPNQGLNSPATSALKGRFLTPDCPEVPPVIMPLKTLLHMLRALMQTAEILCLALLIASWPCPLPTH